MAFEIHRASRRANRPFVRVNCGAVAETLFESEMFGHKGGLHGATEDRPGHFAAAHGGSLVFDEVGTLSEDSQAKLLRVLETGEYVVVGDSRMRRADVRTIAITNEDLAARVKAGTFREDLFFRLNVVPIVVPPLRDRMEDLPELTNYILGQIARRDAGSRRRLGAGALEVLARHDWPGNIRELRNVLEHATILTEGPEIRSETLAGILEGESSLGSAASPTPHPTRLPNPKPPSTHPSPPADPPSRSRSRAISPFANEPRTSSASSSARPSIAAPAAASTAPECWESTPKPSLLPPQARILGVVRREGRG